MDGSTYGKEVYTLGGSRGPSLAYFVPSLSAMQLFLPARRESAGASQHAYKLSDALASQVRGHSLATFRCHQLHCCQCSLKAIRQAGVPGHLAPRDMTDSRLFWCAAPSLAALHDLLFGAL